MDLSALAETAATTYMIGVAEQAASQTDTAALSLFRRVRDYLAMRRGSSQDPLSANGTDIQREILAAITEDAQFAAELRDLIDAPTATIEGAGTIHGNVALRGKYVAGRDINFGNKS